MALVTQCPHCHTSFRVANDQLKLHAGVVRCGSCKQTFNGIEHLLAPQTTPQVVTPNEAIARDASEPITSTIATPAPIQEPIVTTITHDVFSPTPIDATPNVGNEVSQSTQVPEAVISESIDLIQSNADTDAYPEPVNTDDNPTNATFHPFDAAFNDAVIEEIEIIAVEAIDDENFDAVHGIENNDNLTRDAALDQDIVDAAPQVSIETEARFFEKTELADKAIISTAFTPIISTDAPSATPAPLSAALDFEMSDAEDITSNSFDANSLVPVVITPNDNDVKTSSNDAPAVPILSFKKIEQKIIKEEKEAYSEPTKTIKAIANPVTAFQKTDDEITAKVIEKIAEITSEEEQHADAPEVIAEQATEAPLEDYQYDDIVEEDDDEKPRFVLLAEKRRARSKRMRIALGLMSFILLLSATGLIIYYLRDQIATRFPQTKPHLLQACKSLGCQLHLPAQIDVISIESNELTTATTDPHMLSLAVQIRNSSNTAQTWPMLELVLKDAKGKAIVQRVFKPNEYLANKSDVAKGFTANTEQSLNLHFELAGEKAAGYNVYVFYP